MSGLTSWIAVCLRQCKLAGQSTNLPACKRVRLSVGLSACQPAFCNQVVLTGGGGGGLEQLCAERNILFPHFQRPCWPTWRPVILTETASGKEPQRQTGWQTDRQAGRTETEWQIDRQRSSEEDRWIDETSTQEDRHRERQKTGDVDRQGKKERQESRTAEKLTAQPRYNEM